ncbi:MAG: hypothetical protein JRJ84_20205 [Deltaproteobacteria bacterium]|nr:hypothetical protein [Deltaproteobacteria bacterium]
MYTRKVVGSVLVPLLATPAFAQQTDPGVVVLGPDAEVVLSARGADLVVDGDDQVVATDLADAMDNEVYLEFVRELAARIDYEVSFDGDTLTLAPAGSDGAELPTLFIGDSDLEFKVGGSEVGPALAKAKFGDGEYWISNYQAELAPNEDDVALLAELSDCAVAFPGHSSGFDVHVLEDEDGSPVYVATASPGRGRGGPPVKLICGQ